MTYQVNRIFDKNGKAKYFYVTINGKRLSRTNYARKYDALNLLDIAIKKYGKEKLMEMTA